MPKEFIDFITTDNIHYDNLFLQIFTSKSLDASIEFLKHPTVYILFGDLILDSVHKWEPFEDLTLDGQPPPPLFLVHHPELWLDINTPPALSPIVPPIFLNLKILHGILDWNFFSLKGKIWF